MSAKRLLGCVLAATTLMASLTPTTTVAQGNLQLITGWQETTSLPTDVNVWGNAMGFGDHLFYLYPGYPSGTTQFRVLVAEAAPDGQLSAWRETLAPAPHSVTVIAEHSVLIDDYWVVPLPGRTMIGQFDGAGDVFWHDTFGPSSGARHNVAIAAHERFVYSLGGGDPAGTLYSDVQMGELRADGTMTPWQSLHPLPEGRHAPVATVADGYLFVIGGEGPGGALGIARDVLRARINPDGTIQPWERYGLTRIPRTHHSIITFNDTLHIVAGGVHGYITAAVDSLLRTDLGNPATHVASAPIPIPKQLATSAVVRNYGYVLAGSSRFGPPPHFTVHVARLGDLPNQSPVADAGPDQTVESTSAPGADVTLNGLASYDPDGDPITFTWTGSFGTAGGGTSDGLLSVTLPLGTHDVDLTVADAQGESDADTVRVTVEDTTPPVIGDNSASPGVLWPPNHKMRNVEIAVAVSDAADASASCEIESVTSNEPVDGLGDGDSAPDWLVTGVMSVQLRAERAGTGDGRVYSIGVVCADASGNESRTTVEVNVPKSQKR